jgi:hypothetical protein
MLSFDDPRWDGLEGGYKVPFDPRPLLARLESEPDTKLVWRVLWNQLHHQGDVGEASFAAVPHIVRICGNRGALDWNAYAIVAVIELARNKVGNPDVPEWLQDDYSDAIITLAEKGISELPNAQDANLCRAILSVIAIKKGLRNHARFLTDYDEEELEQIDITWKE